LYILIFVLRVVIACVRVLVPHKAASVYVSNKYVRRITNLNTLMLLNIDLSNWAHWSSHLSCQYCLHFVVAVATVLCLFWMKPMYSEHFTGFERSLQVLRIETHCSMNWFLSPSFFFVWRCLNTDRQYVEALHKIACNKPAAALCFLNGRRNDSRDKIVPRI
jgi:hypothetical protein